MLHASSLLRPTCLSKPLIQLYRISRCPSLCIVPELIGGKLPSSTLSLVDMGRRHRNVEVRAVLEADIVNDSSQQGVNDEELLIKMWQGFGRTPVVPLLVKKLMQNTKALEKELGEELKFGGPRGSLKVGGSQNSMERRCCHEQFDIRVVLLSSFWQIFGHCYKLGSLLSSNLSYFCQTSWCSLVLTMLKILGGTN